MDPVLLVTSGMIAFAMAWAIGAQDVSNALGTSVGSNALTVRQAIYVGAVCEFVGSLMGGQVAAAISGGILNLDAFAALGDAGVALYGRTMFVTMCGAFAWLAVATYYSLPVSTTHSLVGSLVGVGIMAMSPAGIRWDVVLKIVSSWLSSPLLGGIVGYTVCYTIRKAVFLKPAPHKAAVIALPYFTGFTFGLLVAFMGVAGPTAYRISALSSVLLGCLVAVGVAGVTSIRLSSQAKAEADREQGDAEEKVGLKSSTRLKSRSGSMEPVDDVVEAPPSVSPQDKAEAMFKTLMIATACVVSFAHGSNDVSNSIGPFSAIVEINASGAIRPGAPVPAWVLIAGGCGIVVGLGTYGYKVMATVGKDITKLTFSRGFAAQIGTATTVLTATQLGVTVSTTHCLIGAISGVALADGGSSLNTATLKKIAASWVITLPASAAFSVALYMAMEMAWPSPM